MTKAKNGSPTRGRPIDLKKRDKIVDAAWSLFLNRGVEAVPLETIAAKAGTSKVTLYKHFPDKASLFEAGVLREMERIEAAQRVEYGAPPEFGDLRTVLIRFGVGIMTFLASPPAVSFYNALAGELSRHPNLARRFYAVGPGRTKANLQAILNAASERGDLRVGDSMEAAEHLFGLWQGFSNFEFALGVRRERERLGVQTKVERAVDVFLRAYRS